MFCCLQNHKEDFTQDHYNGCQDYHSRGDRWDSTLNIGKTTGIYSQEAGDAESADGKLLRRHQRLVASCCTDFTEFSLKADEGLRHQR